MLLTNRDIDSIFIKIFHFIQEHHKRFIFHCSGAFLIPENYIYQKHFTPLEQFQKKQDALLFKPEFIPPFFLQIYPTIRKSKDLKSKFVSRN
ncbi:hypothetical protein B0A80_08830 [Flavobacterium tructae]|nr:hypothetical protein B0A80_08830 [Flavobacterium tructae]